MTTKNLVSKFFAIVLSISLLAGIVTVSPASAISEPLSVPEDESPLTLEKTDTEADIISEDDEGRSLYGKDFLLPDMTRLAVIYPDAVHFPDGKIVGKYIEMIR